MNVYFFFMIVSLLSNETVSVCTHELDAVRFSRKTKHHLYINIEYKPLIRCLLIGPKIHLAKISEKRIQYG